LTSTPVPLKSFAFSDDSLAAAVARLPAIGGPPAPSGNGTTRDSGPGVSPGLNEHHFFGAASGAFSFGCFFSFFFSFFALS
jgi:hypothetical protein